MRVTKVIVGRSAVIAIAAYENLRPNYQMEVEIAEGESAYRVLRFCNDELAKLIEEESNRCKAEWLTKSYDCIRFYPLDNKQVPSVTSILSLCGHTSVQTWWITDKVTGQRREMTADELQQYASRGNVLEAMIQTYLETGQWADPRELPQCREDVEILDTGNLKLSWEDGSYQAFMNEYGAKIKPEAFQKTVFNREHDYAGTIDILGEFDGKRSVMDIKSGTFDMRQLAAYAACEQGVEQLVILPVGPTDNKCGYKKPVICETIQSEFAEFLKARAKFRQRFGI